MDFAVKLEPGVAIPLTAPQTDVFGIGVGQSVKALFGLSRYLDIGPTVSVMVLPAAPGFEEPGSVWGLGGGLRIKRPHDATSIWGISPWVDADALYIRTGALDRGGFDIGAGLSVPLGESRNFWVGPFVRYLHVGQPFREGYDNRDAKLFTIGVSFEAGTGIARKQEALAPVEVPEPRIVTREVLSCPDRDQDTVPDKIDRCPEVFGKLESGGCPEYKKIVVKPDKLELKERLYFAWDEAKLEDPSFPVLDEVVQALKENKGFRVQVQGHADSTGPDDHNQDLSEDRAGAVLDYLVLHGIAKDRLSSKGFSSSVPRDTNVTAEGREKNRRVEFVVSFLLLSDNSPTQ